MSDHLEDLLVRTLRERVEIVDEPVGLVGAARREARAVRHRRIAGTAALVAVLAATAVAVPLRGLDRADAPPGGDVRELKLTSAPALRTVVSLAGLPSGARPATGWQDGDVFHHSLGHDVELPIGTSSVVEQGESTVAVVAAGHPSLRVIDAAGSAGTPVVADRAVADGSGHVAYVENEMPAVVVLSPDGTVARTYPVPDHSLVTPVGFLADDRLLVALRDRDRPEATTYVFVGPGETRSFRSATTIQAVGGQVLAGIVRGTGGRPCVAAEGSADTRDWRACPATDTPGAATFAAVADVSRDGQVIVARGRERLRGETDRIAIIDRRSGALLRELVAAPGVLIGQALADTDHHVLLAVWHDGRAAIVRCGVDGACEAATAARTVSLDDWTRAPMADD